MRTTGSASLLLSALTACAHPTPPAQGAAASHDALHAHGGPRAGAPAPDQPSSQRTASRADAVLAAVAVIHGGVGPWAVAGYRMGQHALARLGLVPGSFDLDVVHATPREVQYACIADGAAAATGASVGKLNLSLREVPAADTHTVYRHRGTGQVVTLRLTPAFVARFRDVPRPELAAAGRVVLALEAAEIFEEVGR
jgi:hypothetical protein